MKRWLIFKVIILSLILVNAPTINAKEHSDQLLSGYTIEGVPNKHQIDKNVSYFYLEEQPGTKDEVKVKIINHSNTGKTFQLEITNANTNLNGLVDYTGTLKEHESLKTPLTSIAKPKEKEITVAPNSERETTIDIQMPSEKQTGIILGGIVVSEKQVEAKKEQGVAIGNTYSYTLGMLLTNDATTEINQNVDIKLENVGAILSNGKKVVQATIVNPAPYIFGEATVSGKIMNEQETKTFQETKKVQVKLAPQSVYPFQFNWEKAELKPGNYIFEGIVQTSDNQWHLKKRFTITATEAKKINEQSVFKVLIPKWIISSTIVLSFITIFDTGYIIIRRRIYARDIN